MSGPPEVLEVAVDRGLCIGAGLCMLTAPEVFDQDEEEGLVVLLAPRPGAEQSESVRLAQQLCPAGALAVRQTDGAGA